MFKQYFIQTWAQLKQHRLISVITIIATALSIFFIMLVVMMDQVKVAPFSPESNRDRFLHVKYGSITNEKWGAGNTSTGPLSLKSATTLYKSVETPEVVSIYCVAPMIGGEYLEKRYGYKDIRIPVQQFTAEGGYYLNFLSDRRKTFFLSAGLSALAGYETSNMVNKMMIDGSTLPSKDRFVFGGALMLKVDTHLTDRTVLLLKVREGALFGSSIRKIQCKEGFGTQGVMIKKRLYVRKMR